MDPEIVAQVRESNEASISLVTLLVVNEDQEAVKMAMTDDVYTKRSTALALGVLACSAIKTIADLLECSPEEVVRAAGIQTAQFNLDLEG